MSGRPRAREGRRRGLSLEWGGVLRGLLAGSPREGALIWRRWEAARVRRTLVCGGAARVRSLREARGEGPGHVLGRQEIDVVLTWCGFGKDGRPATSMASRWVSVPFLLQMHDISSIF